ncbi:MAG: protein-L-isoaspartate(D-aspartate) O-methyltransferase [Chloroflexi bacterium]|nr:protein-L-isoaspartate(D-aspartate) O-methyltransferase [Chloroflexota bacterium]
MCRTLPFLLVAFITTCTPPSAAPIPEAAITPSVQISPTEDATMARRREQMVLNTIEARGIADSQVLNAMYTVPRHLFVPEDVRHQAYADHAVPIGYGQTISQPYIVAMMTELLELQPGDRLLEIGTGSGYQAAILAEIPGVEVYTMEIVPQLAARACNQLQALGYPRIHCKEGDGYYGWPEASPFDAIIVTAAPDHLPQPLADQLAEGGRMVIPIGPTGSYQTLWKFTRAADGTLTAQNMGGVIFVPFTGEGIQSDR